jgi:hypothetical protein
MTIWVCLLMLPFCDCRIVLIVVSEVRAPAMYVEQL